MFQIKSAIVDDGEVEEYIEEMLTGLRKKLPEDKKVFLAFFALHIYEIYFIFSASLMSYLKEWQK